MSHQQLSSQTYFATIEDEKVIAKNKFEKLNSWSFWLSGRVLESRSMGHGFESDRRHCVVSLGKTLFCIGSTQEDLS